VQPCRRIEERTRIAEGWRDSVGRGRRYGGFAVDPPIAQLVQAMAGFGGGSGATDGLNTAALGADTPQQTFLTTPQHV